VGIELTQRQQELLDKLARRVVDLRASAVAIFFLESTKPLSFLGSQVLVFFQPMIQSVFNFKDYETVTEMLENRDSIELLLEKIETLQDEQIKRDNQMKEEKKARKRGRR
jgi:ABC-type uncharacterized transport system involved in gliding motility auxiliary subunit